MDRWGRNVINGSDITLHSIIFSFLVQKKKRSVAETVDNVADTQSHNMYSDPEKVHTRQKRAKDDRKTCTLFLQSDTMLWDRMTKPKDKHGLNYVSTDTLKVATYRNIIMGKTCTSKFET